MLRQDFSISSLLRVTTKNEIIRFNLGRENKDYRENLLDVSERLSNNNLVIENLNSIKVDGKSIYSTDSIYTHYALKKISKDLKRLYRLDSSTRDDISEQLFRILETSSNYSILRLDIKSFYENIGLSNILKKINKDKLLSTKSISILREIENFVGGGLPRGLSISPVLSEIFMKEIDQSIIRMPEIYYYARYVDDIIIISFHDCDFVYNCINQIFTKSGLSFNNKKFIGNVSKADCKTKDIINFDYLGYKYVVTNKFHNKKRIVYVELSEDKKRKIKTRIIHSILDRVHNNQTTDREVLLLNRLKILSSNYPIVKNDDFKGCIKVGMFYSHKLVNKSGVFNEFNVFLSKALFSKKNNFFGHSVAQIPYEEKINIIKNICFVKGFKDKFFLNESAESMSNLKACWRNKRHKRVGK